MMQRTSFLFFFLVSVRRSSLTECRQESTLVMAILFLTARDFPFSTRHIQNWVSFLLWLSLFIPSGAISPLFSSSILGNYLPGGFIFQCHVFLPFYTVYGFLKARVLKWFATAFSSGPCFVRTLHYDPSVLDGPPQHGS